MKIYLAQYLYAAIFCVFLPFYLLLATWQMEQQNLPIFPLRLEPTAGLVAALAGLGIIFLAMYCLMSRGGGLPSNAYPTKKWVNSGIYGLIDHPIYFGFVLLVAGTAVATSSKVGFWLITPLCVLGCCSLVFGYENQATASRLGPRSGDTLIKIPPTTPKSARLREKAVAGLLSIGVFSGLFGLFSTVPTPEFALDLRLAWEYELEINSPAVFLYSLSYLPILVTPLVLRKLCELRRLVIASWLAMAAGFTLMIVLPTKAEWLNGDLNWVAQSLLDRNREFDAEWLSFPSFHIFWSCVCSYGFSQRWPKLRLLFRLVLVGIAASCVFSGQHSIADLLAGLVLYIVCWNYSIVFQSVLRLVERLANSWRAIEIFSLRILSSGIVAALASFVGSLFAYALVDEKCHSILFIQFLFGLSGALLVGHLVEGGGKLSRPFGYFGYLAGSLFGAAGIVVLSSVNAGPLFVAALIGGSIAQGLGRIRCIIQGCCHGKPCPRSVGITYRNPKTRVIAFEKLVGETLFPTQLYSLVSCLATAVLMFAMSAYQWPWTIVTGLYFSLTGMFRFAEESFRGESQTPQFAGLSFYQYLSIVMLVVGMTLIAIPSVNVQLEFDADGGAIWFSSVTALIVFVSMAVDFPESNKPFSRLSPP